MHIDLQDYVYALNYSYSCFIASMKFRKKKKQSFAQTIYTTLLTAVIGTLKWLDY